MDAFDRLKSTLTRKRDPSADKPKRSKSKERAGVFISAEQVAIADIHQEDYTDATASLIDPENTLSPDLAAAATMQNLLDITDSTNLFLARADEYALPPEDSKDTQSRPQSSQSTAYGANDTMFTDPTIDATVSNPWGRFMLPRHLTDVMARTGKKTFDVEEAKTYCKEFNSTVTVTRADLEHTINKKATEIATELYEKMRNKDQFGEAARERKRAADRHFSPYLNQAGIKVPEYFSLTATLTTEVKTSSAFKAFPSKQLFTGKRGPSIDDFLEDCNTAQTNLRLSRTEFEGIFVRCMVGEPQTATRTAFRLGHTIEQVYKSLYMAYNNQITPDEANTKLANLRAPKNMTLLRLITTIQNLAGRATVNYVIQKEKDNVYNTICIEALKRSLPEASQGLLSTNQVRCTTDIGRSLDFLELSMILYPHTKAINTDIERNGVAATCNGSLSIYVAGSNQDDKDDKSYKGSFTNKPNGLKNNNHKPNGTVNEVSASEPQNSTGQSYRNNRGKPPQNN